MINWINLIYYVVSLSIVAYFIYHNFKLRLKVKKLATAIIQLELDKNRLLERFERLLAERQLEKTEGFVGFLEQSRDWAFKYIEDVQSALEEFNKEIVPVLEWNETFGSVVGDNNPHSDSITKISEAYNKLKKVLPQNDQTPNN